MLPFSNRPPPARSLRSRASPSFNRFTSGTVRPKLLYMAELLHLSPEEATAVRLSLRVAFWAMTTSLIPGILIALVLARGRFWGKSLLDGLVHLPLGMPPVVTGYMLLLLLGRRGPLGQFLDEHFGIVFAFRWTGAALACAGIGFPLMVRELCLSMHAR